MDQEASAIVVGLAKNLIAFMRDLDPSWKSAYFRFSSEGFKYGSNGSYVTGSTVSLIDPFESGDFFNKMNSSSLELLKLLGKEKGVLLLSADSSFNYEMKYEFQDMGRWRITKMNGGTGLPEGI